MFNMFKAQPRLPLSFERWSEVDVIASSEELHCGPSVTAVRTLDQWLDEYERWRAGYDEFIKAECAAPGISDDFDKRQHEHYAALLLQSGQWRAILLKLLPDCPESELSKYLAEIDSCLAKLRNRIERR